MYIKESWTTWLDGAQFSIPDFFHFGPKENDDLEFYCFLFVSLRERERASRCKCWVGEGVEEKGGAATYLDLMSLEIS